MSEIKDPLKKIEEFGIEEAAKQTHIEPEYIRAIVNKDFEILRDKNALAYVKILERECEVDLGAWVDEFNAYFADLKGTQKKSSSFAPTHPKEIIIKEPNKLPKFLFWVVLLVIAVWIVYTLKLYDLESFFSDSNETAYSSNTTMIEAAGSKLESVGIELSPVVFRDNALGDGELNALEKTVNLELNSSVDENLSLENFDSNETNATLEDENSLDSTTTSGANLVPKDKIWIGMIDLKNSKKSTQTTAETLEFDLDGEWLILTGHGLFSLNFNGETKTFNDKNPKRFHIKDSQISEISYDEFLRLNDGKAW